jgi:hypothetical protein
MARFTVANAKPSALFGSGGWLWWPVIVLLLASLLSALPARAAQIAPRSLYIADSNPGATTTHTFSFTYASSAAIGSVSFEYCTNPFVELTCDAPAGINASAAVLSAQTGETGFSITAALSNKLVIGRSPASAPNNAASNYTFDNVINPTGPPESFFVRITTYASSDGSGPIVDFGAVVNSTAQAIHVSSKVPPILKFCVGLDLGDDCTTADDSLIDLGDLTTAHVSSGTSQMIAATNAEFGLAIAAYGGTMTSGNNSIPALNTPTVSAPGNGQFGFNLVDNSDPDVGANPTGPGGTVPTSRYGSVNHYVFTSGDTVATSSAATDSRKFTVSYITNIAPSQEPGVYTATITYVCTATF